MQDNSKHLPIAIIGAGPIGLSAAVNLLDAGLTPIIFESGDRAGFNISDWGHVRMFSPWSYNMDPAAVALLKKNGWIEPVLSRFPTGHELLEHYVHPLASHKTIAPHLHLNTRVDRVSRQNHDILRNDGRANTAFVLRISNATGEHDVLAQAVIDTSGTYQTPNWLGTHGIPALGETAASHAISYGVPNILGTASKRYAGKSVLVVGGGHSAFNALQDLVKLSEQFEGTRIFWGIRGAALANIVRSPVNDTLKERRQLEVHIQTLLDQGKIEAFTSISIEKIEQKNGKLIVQSQAQQLPAMDQIIAATGFRPDLSLLSELRTSLDPATESPTHLGPLIDPNLHSCGSVPEHGAAELSHPEIGLYIAGIKSYGRAPTFLLKTGYQQIKSITDTLAGQVKQGCLATAFSPSPASLTFKRNCSA